MRTFYRAAPEYATGTFTELTGKDISSAPAEVGLIPISTPFATPTVWFTPAAVTRPTTDAVRVSLLIDASRTPGDYHLCIKVVDAGETLVRVATDEAIRII